ncbi:unnamed protein product [Macrosiphum euphorbiae]|uniref:DNA polymerase epsilon catalytic subunit n=1 Tax=Macrosiphum euphorbiae TaxID=13131 RepID=A0AAV0XHW9_9HEMI|nr:unnamed protein product [Macrosiphum euphorbiae]
MRFLKNHRSPDFYKFAAVTHYWDANRQIVFETICIRKSVNDYRVPDVTRRWLDAKLRVYNYPVPEIPIIVFDIETVSADAYRVPTGEHPDDVLFSVSVHHLIEKCLYTLVYLPLTDDCRKTSTDDDDDAAAALAQVRFTSCSDNNYYNTEEYNND